MKKFLFTLILLFIFAGWASLSSNYWGVLASAGQNVCAGVDSQGNSFTGSAINGKCCETINGLLACYPFIGNLNNPTPKIQTLGDILKLVITLLLSFVGIVVAAVLFYGGFTYLTAAGDPEKMKKAQSIILYSIIGLVVIGLSVIIIKIVEAVLGINILSSFL